MGAASWVRARWFRTAGAVVAAVTLLPGADLLSASGAGDQTASMKPTTTIEIVREQVRWPLLLPVVVAPDQPLVFQTQWDDVSDVAAVVGRVDGDQLVGAVRVTVAQRTFGPPPPPVTSVFGQPASVANPAGRDGISVTLSGIPVVSVEGVDDDVWAFLASASPDFIDRTRPIDDEVPLGVLPAGYSVITNGPRLVAGGVSVGVGYETTNEEGPYLDVVVSLEPRVGIGRTITAVDINGRDGWLIDGFVEVWGGDAANRWVTWQLATDTYVTVTGDDVEELRQRARSLAFISSDEWFDRYADQLDEPLPPPP